MAQYELLNMLRKKRKESNKWYDLSEIRNDMIKDGCSRSAIKKLRGTLFKLVYWQYIDAKYLGTIFDSKIVYRAKRC